MSYQASLALGQLVGVAGSIGCLVLQLAVLLVLRDPTCLSCVDDGSLGGFLLGSSLVLLELRHWENGGVSRYAFKVAMLPRYFWGDIEKFDAVELELWNSHLASLGPSFESAILMFACAAKTWMEKVVDEAGIEEVLSGTFFQWSGLFCLPIDLR